MVIEYSDNSFEYLHGRFEEQQAAHRAAYTPTDNYQRLAHLVISRDGDALIGMAKRRGVNLNDELVRDEIIHRVRELRGLDCYDFDYPDYQDL